MEMGLLMFPSPAGSADMARMAEQLGFASLVFADTQCLTPEVWSQLMLVATATERIEIGTGVTNPVSRDPSVTASAALGLQVASGGRVVLGIGRGDSSMAKIGRRPAPPADFELYLTRLRAYLDGEEIERDGHPSRIEWLDGCEVPHVPIEVAATGPKVIDIAARLADRICFAVGAETINQELTSFAWFVFIFVPPGIIRNSIFIETFFPTRQVRGLYHQVIQTVRQPAVVCIK